ncbi:MAG: hypothetical protein JWM91_2047 [Rhodospirillales bacterium]|nr:hypothetical protein [Rhodospirillales bacterium]
MDGSGGSFPRRDDGCDRQSERIDSASSDSITCSEQDRVIEADVSSGFEERQILALDLSRSKSEVTSVCQARHLLLGLERSHLIT